MYFPFVLSSTVLCLIKIIEKHINLYNIEKVSYKNAFHKVFNGAYMMSKIFFFVFYNSVKLKMN